VSVRIIIGDCRQMLATLPDRSVQCCVTSPPYFGLLDYGCDGQLGLEPTPDAYVSEMVAVFRDVRRVLRDDGTLWLNIGDSYAGGGGFSPNAPSNLAGAKQTTQGSKSGGIKPTGGLKQKDLIGIPWLLAFALRADGWYLRQDIIWAKPNPMPESVTDRCTKGHEYVFLLSKQARYFYDAAAIAEVAETFDRQNTSGLSPKSVEKQELGHFSEKTGLVDPYAYPTRNRRSVWTIATQPFSGSHFATMPPDLAELCIKAGSRHGDTILDPFGGAGTTGLVADRLQRNATLIELNPAYATMLRKRIAADAGLFGEISTAAE
jgi:DNA modification methylase